ncbi:MAG: HlyD family efflux transporter periplasmic adaptor subunit [Gammaproteobacteria bacterium]|nr:HlyD family efflux transporter periplasmic adaptor subunit [Gammaproteobacteria bacterium]
MSVSFRPEVYRKRKHSLWGKVLVRPTSFYTHCTQAIVFCTFLFVLLLCFGKYSTKETVQGFIEPSQGLVSLYAPQAGNVEELFVSQGSIVHAEEPLLSIALYETLPDGRHYDEHLRQEFEDDRMRLEQQLMAIDREEMIKEKEIEYQTTQSQAQLDSLERQFPIELKNNAVLEKQYERLKKAYEKGSIAQMQLEQVERELALSNKNIIHLESQIVQLKTQLKQPELALQQLKHQYQERRIHLEQQLAQLKRTLLDLDRRTHTIITSPVDGVVTQLDLQKAQMVRPGEHLVDLKKKDDTYRAKLFVPSGAIGFIKIGQSVSIRVQAFPHQHYGSLRGTIEQVTDSVYQGNTGQHMPQFYIVYVSLPQQSMSPDGRFPLKQGMQLDADIKTQQMTFMQKIFEPLYRMARSE